MSERNPVALMDSVNAMDIMEYSHRKLKAVGENPKRLAEIKEQERRHRHALRKHIDGGFEREDAPEVGPEEIGPKKKLQRTKKKSKVLTRRSK